MPLTIIFLGKAGAGKGTQGHLLEQKFKTKVIGTGDLLRAFAKLGLPASGRIEKEVLLAGKLAPSWFVSYLWIFEVLHTLPAENTLFDGSPRMLPEALLIDDVLDWNGRIPPKVFLLDISDAEATRRLLSRRVCEVCKKIYQGDSAEVKAGACPCGGKLVKRHDDTPQAIESRLAYFKTDVLPVVEHYEKKGWLIRINGEQPAQKVHGDILKYFL